jgi:tRNA dimethylallyltransferase
MMEEGLLSEVIRLRDQGMTLQNVSMQGLGYKQLLEYLEGKWSLEEAVQQIKLQTRHFAKRQLTWFKREKDTIWLNADEYCAPEEIAQEMQRYMSEMNR